MLSIRESGLDIEFSRLTRDGLGVSRGGGWGGPVAHLAGPPISSKPGRTTPRSGALSDPDLALAKPCSLQARLPSSEFYQNFAYVLM